MDIINKSHQIKEFEETDNRNRTMRRVCRYCSGIGAHPDNKGMKRTKMFCTICNIPLHPQCFTAYHITNHIPIVTHQVDIDNVTNIPPVNPPVNPSNNSSKTSSKKRTRTT